MTRPGQAPHLHAVTAEDAAAVLCADGPTLRRGPVKLRTSWTAADLMRMHFPPPVWAVPGVIAEGVTLFCGPPKVGKSWLSLGLGLTIAAGGLALGSIRVKGGPVLYLALEDTPRRLQLRMGKLLDGQPAPSALTLATECPPLPQGGDEAIAAWLDRNRDARMVVIDVFAKLRGMSAPGMSAYDADYAAVGRAKRVADAYGVAVVLVHHVRKAGSEDFLDMVSGTNGLAGAADATMVLKRARGQADGALFVTGRDVDEAEYAMAFQPACGAWQLLDGPASDHTIGNTRAEIIRHLRANPGSTPKMIAEATGLAAATVRQTCTRMLADCQVTCDASGRYALPGDPTATVTPVTRVARPALTCGNGADHE
jgi:AAA domain